MPLIQQHALANVIEGFLIWKMFAVCSKNKQNMDLPGRNMRSESGGYL